jgi:hypothetical protein
MELYKQQEGQRKQIPQLKYYMEEDFQTSSNEEKQFQTEEYIAILVTLVRLAPLDGSIC